MYNLCTFKRNILLKFLNYNFFLNSKEGDVMKRTCKRTIAAHVNLYGLYGIFFI